MGRIAELRYEKLKLDGHAVSLVTTAADVSQWTKNTLEEHRAQARVQVLGIAVIAAHYIARIRSSQIDLRCIYTAQQRVVPAASLVMVTSRHANNELHRVLTEDLTRLAASGIGSVTAIGDCCNPSTIAAAVHDGHRVARELDDAPVDPDMPFRRERILLEDRTS